MRDEIEHQKTWETGILKLYEFSNVWFNLTLYELNLISWGLNLTLRGLNLSVNCPTSH